MNRSFTYLLKKLNWRTWFVFLTCCMTMFNRSHAQTFLHPGVPFTRADLAQLKANITKEPWLTGYNALKGDPHSQLSYGIHGPYATVTRAPNLNNSGWRDDMNAIHNLAFMYVFTGDSAYARKATNMLDAWAVTNTVWGGGENQLDIGDMAPYFVAGADILRSTFPGWSAANDAHVNNYFRNVLYPTSGVPYPLRDCNKGALQLQIAVGIAAYLGDPVLWQQAIEVYRMDAGGGLRASLPNGEVGDSGRDDHWWIEIQALGWSAEVAWKQGIDLFSEYDNRLLAISELYSQHSQAPNTTGPFIPFGGYSNYWTGWGIPPGYIRQSPFNNIIKGAYALRKGIPDTYTEQMRAVAGEGAWSFLYLKSSDTSHAAPLTPIIYPASLAQPVSSNLSNIDIGSTGIAGSSSFGNGNWTIRGAGNSVASATNFTFRQVHGDVGIIVKVESNSISSANTGIMIRGSLTGNANFISANLNGAGGMSSSWSGANGQTQYSHYQPQAPWWLKIERIGNRVFTYHSQDGVNWTNNALFIMPTLPADTYIGLYTVSNNTSALNTAVFSHVAITNTSPAGSPEINSQTAANIVAGSTFSYTITATGNATAYSATGLPAGLSLDANTGSISGTPAAAGTSVVTLGATNASGTGYATLVINVADGAVPAAITNLAAAVVNSTNISLSWTGATNATSYNIKRSQSPAGPFNTIQSGVTATTFVDANPVPEVNNYYVVSALSGTQESGNSNVVSAAVPPAAPAQPVVVNKNKEIDLSWNSASGAATYNVKRGTLSGGPYTTVANVSTTSYVDLNVTNGSPYYYVVSSVGQTKESANSVEAFGVPGSSSVTWSPNPQTDSLLLAANWNENMSPVNPAVINFHASADTTLVNDINGLVVSRMQFYTDATAAYSIGGNGIHLRNDLVNNSGDTHTLTMPVVLDTLLNVNTTGSGGRVSMTGVLSGNGSLVKNGVGFLTLSGANTYTGNTTLNGNPQSWPPVCAVEMAGTGTGTPSAPTSGPLGTGKLIMNGGALVTGTNATIYNDIVAVDGTKSYLYQTGGAMNLYGNITGSGTIWQDGNVTAGLHLYGDNSNFTGTFVSALRSGNSRTRFETPQSGSAKASWLLDANGIDCMGVTFGNGTLNFGALSGRGYIRNDGGGAPVISIGALNTNTSFGGTIASFFNIEKVGTGNLAFTGNHTYGGTTTVKAGKFLLNNDPVAGVFGSPVIVNAGSFGGTGKSTGPATIGTGTGPGSVLEPGNLGVGTLIVSDMTLNADATYNAELNFGTAKGDKITVNSATLVNSPVLAVTGIAGTLPLGTSFTIIDNTGNNPVSGTFKNLPELALVNAGAYNFRITYKGGTGNDVVLLDDRTKGVTITSALTDTVLIGKAMSYAITAIKSPNSFSATGLPAGVSINATTGVISGVPSVSGSFPVTLTATDGSTADTVKLALVVQSNIVANLKAIAGDGQAILTWDAIIRSNFTYHVKRSLTPGGPYTIVGNAGGASYLDGNLINGTSYYYVIASADSTGENPNSAEVSVKPVISNVSYWPMDEGSGTTATDIWNGRKGTLNAAVTWTTGQFNSGVHSDATASSYTTLPANLVSTLTDFTISAWVKQDVAGVWGRVFDFGSGTTNYMFLSPKGTTGFPRYAITTGSGEQGINGTAAIPTGVWTHMAVTQSGSVAILYVNGVEVGRNTAMTLTPSSMGNTAQNYIGKSQWSADPILNGSIDDFRIYSRALTPVEINVIKNLTAQTITFNALAQQTVGNADVDPGATASSGLAVSYLSGDTTIAKIVSGKIHAKGAGTVLITALQAGNGSFAGTGKSQTLTVVGPPPVPVLTATAADGLVPLSWNASTGATSYNVKRSTASGGPFTTIRSLNSASYTDSTVVNGTTYFYVVSSVNALGESANSAQVTARPAISPGSSYWTFNETSGTTATDVWNGRVATLNSGATFVTGYSNNALHVDGTANGYATLPAGVVSSLNDFTISARVKMDAISTWMRLFDLGTSTTNYMFLSVQVALSSGKSTVRYAIKNGGTELNVSYAYTFPLNTWVNLAVTQSGNTASLYINGSLVATNASLTIKPSNLGNTTLNYLGKSQFSADPMFKGTIDDFRIINRALSAAEMAKLQNAADQTISFAAISPKHVGDADFDPSAIASSGLSVKYASSDTTIATIVSGKIHIKGVGMAVITATQTGNNSYNAALPVSRSLMITKGDQAITFAAIAVKHVGDADLDPMAVSSSGLPVTYTSSDTTIAAVVNGKIHIKAAGTSTLSAIQTGNNNYNAAVTVTQPLTVIKYDQTITFAAIAPQLVGNADLDPLATASSGLAVTYAVSDTTVAVVINGKVHITAAGTSVITASQSGNLKFAAATSVDQTLTVNKRDQSITFDPLAQQHVGASDLDPLAVSTSGLAVSYASSDTTIVSVLNGKLHFLASGTVVITAFQNGDPMFAIASPVQRSLTVIKNDQTITFNAFTPKSVNDTDLVTGASASSGLPLSYTSSDTTVAKVIGGKVHITGAGSTDITASQNGNFAYFAATPVTQTLTVKKLTQQLTFNPLPAKRPGDADLALTATASTGLPVTYTSSNVNVATIVSGKIHVIGVGTAQITATQAGNSYYDPATATQNFNVLPLNLQVQSLDGDNGQVNNNVIRPYFRIANLDSVAVAYNQLTVRYWFTAENFAGINTWIDYAQLGNNNVTMNYVALNQPRNGALGYIEYKILANGTIAPNSNSGPVQSRFANQDWSLLSETDDYSYRNNTGNYAANTHMTMYRNGSLIWGDEPASVTPATSLSITYQNQNQSTSGNAISTYLSVNNNGNVPVAYSDITARYWFTEEGTQPLIFWKDYVKLGGSNVNGTFTKMSVPKLQADTYLELSFSNSAGVLYPLSNTGNIQYRITKADWSAFNESNDHSYAPKAAPAGNAHITLYYKGQLIYGTEPADITQMNLMSFNDRPKNTEEVVSSPEIQALIIFPNPSTSGNFSIRLTKDLINKPLTVRVYSPDGRLAMTKQFGGDAGDIIQMSLPAPGIPGVCQVRINDLPGMKLLVVR
ncbi:LamG-like jellyroll fold domain-containing protein [Mucilaginibacter sp. AW1-3]